MSFADIMKSDVAALHRGEFRESATYLPRGEGTARPIDVVVDREPIQTRQEADAGVQVVMLISANNDGTTGILASEWQRGDRIRIAYILGGPTGDWPLPSPSLQDDGALVFRINKV